MNARQHAERARLLQSLASLGFTPDEAQQLRRISMTLRRWYEAECGTDRACIVRGRLVNGEFQYDDRGYAFWEFAGVSGSNRYARTPDRETGAITRLRAILNARNTRQLANLPTMCPNCQQWQHATNDERIADCFHECRKLGFAPAVSTLTYYLQTDPRGCALYIIRPGDVPDGRDVAAYYPNGLAIY